MSFKNFTKKYGVSRVTADDIGLGSPDSNQYYYEQFMQDGVVIGKIAESDVMKLGTDDRVEYTVIDHLNKTIEFMCQLSRGPDGIYGNFGIWKYEHANFYANDVILNFILPDLKFIVSDLVQTEQGKKMWKNLFKSAGNRIVGSISKGVETVYNTSDDLDHFLESASRLFIKDM